MIKTKHASTNIRTHLVVTRFSCSQRLSYIRVARGLGHLLPPSVTICTMGQIGSSTRTHFSTACHACGCCIAAQGSPFGHRCT